MIPLASNSTATPKEAAAEAALGSRQSKWPKPAVKGHPGKGNWWDSWSKEWEKDQQAQNSGLDRQTTTLLKALTKMALRHEDELSRVRPDSTS